jgi:hypothetical protein
VTLPNAHLVVIEERKVADYLLNGHTQTTEAKRDSSMDSAFQRAMSQYSSGRCVTLLRPMKSWKRSSLYAA